MIARSTQMVAILALAALAGTLAGCGAAEAEPLEVTYYYLPG